MVRYVCLVDDDDDDDDDANEMKSNGATTTTHTKKQKKKTEGSDGDSANTSGEGGRIGQSCVRRLLLFYFSLS